MLLAIILRIISFTEYLKVLKRLLYQLIAETLELVMFRFWAQVVVEAGAADGARIRGRRAMAPNG